jgi:hypothetical protein
MKERRIGKIARHVGTHGCRSKGGQGRIGPENTTDLAMVPGIQRFHCLPESLLSLGFHSRMVLEIGLRINILALAF